MFRAEALHAQQQRWLGELRLVTPLSTRVLVGGIALIVAVLAVFASLGTYTRRVHATGMLAPATGLLTLAAPTAGRVQHIAIREGASVAAGQVLAVVSSERQSLAGNTSSAVLSQLATQRTRLGNEIADAEQLAVQQRSGLAQRMALLRAQLHSLEQQRLLAREQAAQSAALLARIAPLGDKGYVSAFEIARQRSAKLEAESQVKALDRQLIELRQQLAATQDQSAQLPLNLASQRSGLQRQRAGIEQALAQPRPNARRSSAHRAPGASPRYWRSRANRWSRVRRCWRWRRTACRWKPSC
ncbi:membrane fusion transmembrane protein [mine drainage metagenome]|uniref:Membrane fusion transmembrane protein n=1 Tax=mine drainage metagenome TaxID=410659 RepID=T1C9X9_9ZZZZ